MNKRQIATAQLLSKYLYWRINDETTIGLLTFNCREFFREISRRLFISPKQLAYLTGKEVVEALKGEPVDLDIILSRQKGFATILNPKGVAVVSGKSLESLKNNVRFTNAVTKAKTSGVYQGTAANPGKVVGKVRVVLDPSLVKKVKRGEVLVTTNTNPAYVVAMKISGAILTEEGGITSHAAIVSRELGVPCVIGIPFITKVFKDGDMVEVDANKGIVRKLK